MSAPVERVGLHYFPDAESYDEAFAEEDGATLVERYQGLARVLCIGTEAMVHAQPGPCAACGSVNAPHVWSFAEDGLPNIVCAYRACDTCHAIIKAGEDVDFLTRLERIVIAEERERLLADGADPPETAAIVRTLEPH